MLRPLLILALPIALCACGVRREAPMASIGMTRAEVVALMGEPVRSYTETGVYGRVEVLLYPSDRGESDQRFPGAVEYRYLRLRAGAVYVHGYFIDKP